MPLSTQDLSGLREPNAVEALTRSLAILEAIMSPDCKYRYFQFDPAWDVAKQERLATMDNGSGDGYFLVFSPAGAFLKGFAHESFMTPWAEDPLKVWDGVLDEVPAEFEAFLSEPAFDMASTTFCVWRKTTDSVWSRGEIAFPEGEADPDGSKELLWMLGGDPATYAAFCAEYYERQVEEEAVRAIYTHTPISRGMVEKLNPDASFEDVSELARALSYPIDS